MTETPWRWRLSRRRFGQLAAATGGLALAGALGYGRESARLPAPSPTTQASDPFAPAGQAPILLAISASSDNPFGHYLREILRAEGLNSFRVARLDMLDRAELATYATVLLAEGRLETNQIAMIEQYVRAGGNLIAFRPDRRLAGLLGLSFLGGQTTDSYIGTTAAHSACQGIATDTLQFHGPADHVALEGAEPIAWLYSSRVDRTAFPAITINRAGAGQAAFWAFDLARSVALTRQGNPAWGNQERDRFDGIRACDMFAGWVDLERLAVPQADEQQRLLINLLVLLSERAGPLPRLWYFPAEAGAALITTGDAHGSTAAHIDDVLGRVERYGGHMSVYFASPLLSPLQRIARKARWWAASLPVAGGVFEQDWALPKPAQLAAWRARGHEFGMHPYVEAGLAEGYNAYWNQFVKLGYTPVSPTTRTHRILWHAWVETARVQAEYNLRMNLDYYHVGPAFQHADGQWVYGHFTGSGLPMKFIDETGAILDVYQQNTQLADEHLMDVFGGSAGLSADAAIAVSQQLIQSSLQSYPAAIGLQCHIDPFVFGGEKAARVGRWLEGTLEYAAANSVSMLSAERWLAFTEARAATRIENLAWDTATGRLLFQVSVPGPAAADLDVLVPVTHSGQPLQQLRVGDTARARRERVVGGQRYAALRLGAGDHLVQAQFAT